MRKKRQDRTSVRKTIDRAHVKIAPALFALFLFPLAGSPAYGGWKQNSATRPVPSQESRAAAAGWKGRGDWRTQHEDINKIGQTRKVELVFLGDSITQSWGGEGRQVWASGGGCWQAYYSHRRAANFGISGDRTQHILWRIDNGNFDRISPRVIVLMIGTNNMQQNTAEEIAEGIEAIVSRLRNKTPASKILLLGIFPRGRRADDPLRIKARKVNGIIGSLADGKRVTFLDIGDTFLNRDGTANPRFMRGDFVHLQIEGYRVWAEAIEGALQMLLKETVSIIPRPAEMEVLEGEFLLDPKAEVIVQKGSKWSLS